MIAITNAFTLVRFSFIIIITVISLGAYCAGEQQTFCHFRPKT